MLVPFSRPRFKSSNWERYPGNWLDCHCRRLGEWRDVVMQTMVGDVVRIEVSQCSGVRLSFKASR